MASGRQQPVFYYNVVQYLWSKAVFDFAGKNQARGTVPVVTKYFSVFCAMPALDMFKVFGQTGPLIFWGCHFSNSVIY